MSPQQQTCCSSRFAAVGPEGRRYWSIAAAAAVDAGSATLLAYVGTWTHTCLLVYMYAVNIKTFSLLSKIKNS